MKLGIAGLGWWGGTLVDAVEASEGLKFIAAYTRSRSQQDQDLAARQHLQLADSFEAMLANPDIDGVVLATPPTGHANQIVAAAAAGVTLGLGYNRRFHPSWLDLKQRITTGELGTILHAECTMSGPNGLNLAANAWRGSSEQAPCGGLFPMGVHAVDGFIDLFGDVENVFCQSFRRAVPGDNDDTTSVLFRMKSGMSAYLGTMMATAGTFRFQVYGSKAMALLGGSVHVAGQSSQHRRSGLFGSYVIQPVKGDAIAIEVPAFDVNRAELEAFAQAAAGGTPYPISHAQMIHGVAVTDAIIASARTSQFEHVL